MFFSAGVVGFEYFGTNGFLILQENIPIEEVFQNLRCNKEGLSSEAAEQRLVIFGHNKLEEKKVLIFLVLCLLLLFLITQVSGPLCAPRLIMWTNPTI